MTYKFASSPMKKPRGEENLLRRPPLYQQAADLLRGKLREMTPGTRLPSEHLLADQYGISITTLREAVRILASEGLVTRKQGLGTFISEPPSRKEGYVALLIHHDVSSPSSAPIHLQLAQEVRAGLEAQGYASRIYISRRPPGQYQVDFDCPEFFEDLDDGRIAGVVGILLAADAPWYDDLAKRGITLVGFGRGKPYGVTTRIESFFENAIAELQRRGKSRFAMISWGGYREDPSGHREVFRETVRKAGFKVVDTWIKDDVYPTLEGAGWGALREVWSARKERPDALVVTDDFFLGGISAAISEGGIQVPDQLEIAAYVSNDSGLRYPFPIIAWKLDVATVVREMVDAEVRFLSDGKLAPSSVFVPVLRAPELDSFTHLLENATP